MDFEDKTLVKLVNPATRGGLFDDIALEQILSSVYDTNVLAVEAPYSPLFDEFQVGLDLQQLGKVEGTLSPVGGGEKTEAYFNLSGVGGIPTVRVDALWRGGIKANAVPMTGKVEDVDINWPNSSTIDQEIIDDLGALPQDQGDLETERRARLIHRIKDSLDQPEAFTEELLDNWLKKMGADSVGDYLFNFVGTVHPSALKIKFSPPANGVASVKVFPITAAMLIRDNGFSVAQLVSESKLVKKWLEPYWLEKPKDSSLLQRESLVIIWIIPKTVFDDADWPGEQPGMDAAQKQEARRIEAGKWLAMEGIGLVAIA